MKKLFKGTNYKLRCFKWKIRGKLGSKFMQDDLIG